MNRYFVMYRKMSEFKDRLFEVQAKTYDECMTMLPDKGVPKEVQHMFIHEHRVDGSVVEVLSYENPDIMGKKKKTESKAIVPVASAKPPAPAVVVPLWKKPQIPALTGNRVREHYYTAREISIMNLIKELGAPYVNEMYSGACFLHEGTPHMFAKAGAATVTTHKLVENNWKPAILTPDDFPDMSKFAWPMLGYRNIQYRDHTIAMSVSAMRSAKRGLRNTLLKTELTPTTLLLTNPDAVYGVTEDGVTVLREALAPTYYTLPRAIAMVMDGKAIGCAINANLAVEINPFSEVAGEFSVLWRGTKIGTVSEHGVLSVPSRIAMRIPR